MRSRWVADRSVESILDALTPANRLACEMSWRYGMRIGDVLDTRTRDVQKGRWSYREEKTDKRRRVCISEDMRRRLLGQAGAVYVFEGRLSPLKHRTRFAVYKDIRRAAELFRLGRGVSPHSLRKAYAVRTYHEGGNDLKRVQRLLNHDDEAVTMIYALADQMESNRKARKRGK